MENNKWRTIAIIFIILFILETALIVWSINIAYSEEDNWNECLYNICGEYPDAYYQENVCECYDYDVLGNLMVAKTEYMKN